MAFGIDMDSADWLAADVLQVVHGLTPQLLSQRIFRNLLDLQVPDRRGKATLFTGRDVLQIALHHELTRQGIIARGFPSIWKVVDARISKRAETGDPEKLAGLFHVDHDGFLKLKLVREDVFTLADLDRDAAGPDDRGALAQAMIRIDVFIDDVVERLRVLRESADDYDPDGSKRAAMAQMTDAELTASRRRTQGTPVWQGTATPDQIENWVEAQKRTAAAAERFNAGTSNRFKVEMPEAKPVIIGRAPRKGRG
ncbi:MAG: hypothetical protein ACFCVH_03760 [Alphaproteobacteria bacterium]